MSQFRISNFEFRNPREWGLYLVTDRHQTGGRDLLEVLGQALAAGAPAIQLREKDLQTIELYRLAEQLLAMTRKVGAALIVNDRVDVALALGADGVQLTRKSLPPKEVRAIVGPRMWIGVSCHGLEDVREAVDGGADFVVVGPIYATPSKAAYGPPLAPAILREARRLCSLPLLAIGGIRPSQVREVVEAGADGVAVISAVLAAANPAAATRALLDAVTATRASRQSGD